MRKLIWFFALASLLGRPVSTMAWNIAQWPGPDASQWAPQLGLTNLIAVSAGDGHSMALRSDGNLVWWGPQTNTPRGLAATAIAAGYGHSLAVRPNGSVAAWGSYLSTVTNVPAAASNVIQVAAADSYNLALRADGKVVTGSSSSPNPLIP